MPRRIGTIHSGKTTCRAPGSLRTWGGSPGAIQWIRWSCQRASGSEEIFSQSVSAESAFLAMSGGFSPSREALMYVAGERRFWKTPPGPIRR